MLKIRSHFRNKSCSILKLSKNVNNKKCAPKLIFFNEKKIEKDSDNFWCRKLTLKVKRLGDFALFDTSPMTQFSKFNNFFWVCWFLGKNLSNFVPPAWKLYNSYCHNAQWMKFAKYFLTRSWFCGLKSKLSFSILASGCSIMEQSLQIMYVPVNLTVWQFRIKVSWFRKGFLGFSIFPRNKRKISAPVG